MEKMYTVTTMRKFKGRIVSERKIDKRSIRQVNLLLTKLINLACSPEYGGFDFMRYPFESCGKTYDAFVFSTYPKGSDYGINSITVYITERTW